MTPYQIIKNAILNKQPVTAMYDGYYRELCPHVIGTKDGVEQCLCYQYGGDSSRGKITFDSKSNWRCMIISKFSQVTATTGPWHTFENHSKSQTCVDVIDAEAAF